MSDFIAKAEEIVKTLTVHGSEEGVITYCVLGLIDLDGSPALSAITAAKATGINCVSFCTSLDSPKVKRIQNNRNATACFCSDEYNISLTGKIEIVTEQSVKDEMWYGSMSYYFSGSNDPSYCVLRLNVERYNIFLGDQEFRGILSK